MSRRLRFLALTIFLLFGLVIAQAVNVQFVRAPALDASPLNPRIANPSAHQQRGEIIAANGQILARSTLSGTGQYVRQYPLGSLTSGVVGFDNQYYGTWGLESEYNAELTAHAQPAQSLAQVISPTTAANNIVTTLQPAIQVAAEKAIGNQVGAAVVLDPRTGAVLALYSSPRFSPTPFSSTDYATSLAAWKADTTPDQFGFPPLGLMATQQTFPPGSTFKVITTAAAAKFKPALLKKSYPYASFAHLPTTTNVLENDGGSACGGTVVQMLPVSCDPGYGLLGLDIGAKDLAAEAQAFGYNARPPLDMPYVDDAKFPGAASFAQNLPGLAYSAIGQENVRATTLQQALVAAAIADHGTIMVPHLLASIIGPDGTTVSTVTPQIWKQPLRASQASGIIPLMVNVVRYGTAAGVGFLPQDDVAAKTGTAQTGNPLHNTDDWMIAFAPASHPTVAIAVVMPFQDVTHYGATVAGPVVKCLVEATLALQAGQPTAGTSTTCPS